MRKLLVILVALLASSCQLKSEDPVTTTAGHLDLTKPITVQWATAPGVVQGYKVEVSVDGSKFLEQAVVDGSYNGIVLNAPIGLKYWVRVRAFNQAGNSPYTAVQTVQL